MFYQDCLSRSETEQWTAETNDEFSEEPIAVPKIGQPEEEHSEEEQSEDEHSDDEQSDNEQSEVEGADNEEDEPVL